MEKLKNCIICNMLPLSPYEHKVSANTKRSCWKGGKKDSTMHNHLYADKKGKAVLLQAWSGPEGSRKLRFPHFLTMAQDGGKVVSLTHQPHLPQGDNPGTHFC
jgi:hypothetical protein